MKTLLLGFILLGTQLLSSQAAAESWEPAYTALLQKYVQEGQVDYASWKKNSSDLQQLDSIIQSISRQGPSSLTKNGRLAYHLNAYNAWVLKGVLDRYPVNSVREIAPMFGFFTGKRIVLNGQKISLNHLEKQLLLKEFQDPRIHFAINCASISCPPLSNRAFTETDLEQQLNAVTTTFLNSNPEALRLDQNTTRLHVSSLFDWYAGDFKPSGGTIPFINRYRSSKLPENSNPSFQDYNWQLNQKR
jgi:hypothetical protein